MIIRILMLLLLGVFISCKNEGNNNQRPENANHSLRDVERLDGTWELFKVNDTLFSIEKVYASNYGGQPRITINTDKNKIGGFTGCNSWGTTLNFQENSFVLNDPIEKNEQGCEGTWESTFLNNLKNNKSFELIGEDLKLTSGNQESMTFRSVK